MQFRNGHTHATVPDPHTPNFGLAMEGNSPDRTPSRRTALKTAAAGAAALTASAAGQPAFARQSLNSTLVTMLATSQASEDTNLKRRAAADYRRSMERFGGQLSNPPEQLFHTSTLPPEKV